MPNVRTIREQFGMSQAQMASFLNVGKKVKVKVSFTGELGAARAPQSDRAGADAVENHGAGAARGDARTAVGSGQGENAVRAQDVATRSGARAQPSADTQCIGPGVEPEHRTDTGDARVSASEQLWSARDAGELDRRGRGIEADGRIEAQVGYGLRATARAADPLPLTLGSEGGRTHARRGSVESTPTLR